jgi:hypothetical protein
MKGMTSEKALEQLKAAKEKLDLELITKAENHKPQELAMKFYLSIQNLLGDSF